MKKASLFFASQVLAVGFLFAQTEDLQIRTGDKGLYLEHKVTAKENFYSIGRLFNVPPKYLASYNALDMAKGLNIGQTMRIPLMDSNFSQKTDQGVPLYIKVGEKEGLAHISAVNNKVPVESLRQWNNLSNDNVAPGTKLVVGFLVAGELAKGNSAITSVKEEPIYNPTTNDNKAQPVTKTTPVKEDKKIVVKEEPKKEEPKVETVKMPEAGYFKDNFEEQVKAYPLSKEATVTSGIFKTTNGWQDAKYYALLDGVEPGTIIKVTNPTNNKLVYAKVLGEMKGIRQNQGFELRISNAAASALEIAEQDKFSVKVNY